MKFPFLHPFRHARPTEQRLLRAGSNRRGPLAFTIVELVIVVGIIVLLMAITIPSIGAFRRHAEKAGATALLNTLRLGLNQYYSDHSMYPESHVLSGSNQVQAAYGGTIPLSRGSIMLAQGLVGFLPNDQDGAGPVNKNGSAPSPDPKDPEYGFRTRPYSPQMGSKIYGPYVPADLKYYSEKRDQSTRVASAANFFDPWEREILYYRSNLAAGALPFTPVGSGSPLTAEKIKWVFGDAYGGQGKPECFFDMNDNANVMYPAGTAPGGKIPLPTTGASGFYRQIAGPPPPNGTLGAVNGVVLGSDSYLLISAGPDGIYFNDDDLVISKQ